MPKKYRIHLTEAEFESILRRNAMVGRAWTDRENFARFWECRTKAEGRQFFDRWESAVFKRKKLEPMKQVAKTLRRHLEGLINCITHPLTNALAEGLNSLISVLKGAVRGLRNFANFRTRILFYGMPQEVEDALGMALHHVRHLGQGGQFHGPRRFQPVPQKFHLPAQEGVFPEVAEVFLQRPCAPGFEV